MARFGLSKTETVNQVHGIGPFKTQRLVPIYELNDKGVFFDPSATPAGASNVDEPARMLRPEARHARAGQ
jgi:hypothetical protein